MLWIVSPPGRVFLSHTSELRRLPVGRSFVAAAESAVIRAGGVPVDMAYFSADARPPARVCKEAVCSADVFVGIVGFRYGSRVADCPDLSYVEFEFQEATKAGRKCLMFLLGEDAQGPAELFRDVEYGRRQEEFRASLSECGVTIVTITSPEGLSEALYQALVLSNHGLADVRGWKGPGWAAPPLRGDEVARPQVMMKLVAAVTRPGAGAVGMTTGLWGAGGFGKTTMARLLLHDPQVRDRFPDGMVWVTVGEDATGPELAEKVTNAVYLLSGSRPPLTDPLAAGVELGRALEKRRVLLVVDDVWTSGQAEPFLVGGSDAVRLFTTRVRGVLPHDTELVQVNEMNRSEAAQLLIAGVGEVSSGAITGLLAVTGQWPVLLALVNGAVRADHNAGRRAEESMCEILLELRTTGPTALDVTDADERHTAIARTIGVSLSRLTADQRARYLELAVFREDLGIPTPVLARYWKVTAGWSQFQTRRFCQRLAELALVSDYCHDPEQMVLHDVLLAYLREQTQHQYGELNQALIDAHRNLVSKDHGMSAWWQLPAEQTYLWAWLPTHLHGAGLEQEMRTCLHHPKWLVRKLEYVGPAGLEADLTLSEDRLSRTLRTVIRQNADILGPLEPSGSLAATLATRLHGDEPTRALAEQLMAGLRTPHLRAITALPDLPHPALLRVLTGPPLWVNVLAAAPDGSGLAAGGYWGEVWILDPATGTTRYTLTGHTGPVEALVFAPDGSWLASADYCWAVRIWDLTTGTTRHVLTGHTNGAKELMVAPDGSWLALIDGVRELRVWDLGTAALIGQFPGVQKFVFAPDESWCAHTDGGTEVRIWDPVTGTTRHILGGHANGVEQLVVAPDGSWLASTDDAGEVRVWDPATGALINHTSGVDQLVVAPDGSWLACSADDSGEVRIWDPATGITRHILGGHANGVEQLVVAPDGSWLACAGVDGKIRIWDLVTGATRHILTHHLGAYPRLAVAPDGSWLAYARTGERAVRVWDPNAETTRYAADNHCAIDRVEVLAAPPDGSWVASAGFGGEVRIWDPLTGIARHILTSHASSVNALTVAPDGSWLAASGREGNGMGVRMVMEIWDPVTGTTCHNLLARFPSFPYVVAPDGSWSASTSHTDNGSEVRIWDPLTGTTRHILTGHTRGIYTLTVAPDGSWLASAGTGGEIRIWDVATGTNRHTFLTGRTQTVFALAVAPDGSWFASIDGVEVRIWDPITGAALTSLRVSDVLFDLLIASTTIVGAGVSGIYFLTLCDGTQTT
jgi:WD40 repeat protein